MCLPAFGKKEHISEEPNFEQKLESLLEPKRFRETSCPEEDPFESDYFRVVTSAPFRRLQDKTQIFPLEERDFARRRLTHSIEVACIARQLATKIEEELIKKGLLSSTSDIVKQRCLATIVETAGLVHDIGNPPYGHFGEATIKSYFDDLVSDNSLSGNALAIGQQSLKIKDGDKEIELNVSKCIFKEFESKDKIVSAYAKLSNPQRHDLMHFDGNVQGFRILCQLGLSADDNSFNLTFPVLASIMKYPHASTYADDNIISPRLKNRHDAEKIGYFDSEKDRYTEICRELHLRPDFRHPLAYIVEAADDIVNVTSDVEDGFKMGVILCSQIKELANENAQKKLSKIEELTAEKIQSYIDNQSAGCHNIKYKGRETTDDLWVKEFRIRALHILVNEAVDNFVNHAEQIINEAYDDGVVPSYDDKILGNELLYNSDLRKRLQNLQTKTYQDLNVMKTELLGEHVITGLLDLFLDALFSDEMYKKDKDGKPTSDINYKSKEWKVYSLISSNYRRAVCTKDEVIPSDPYLKFLLAVDYVAGMTDSYALDLYNQLTNKK